ncbi:ABC-three component system protein [Methylobacterium indicum]|uniref:ABC-three component system protein n=1 Tax=Methylobacterium indicum TaxID=1775910 RepID=UPI0009EB12C4|nr:ABC-three component system protein [Methylobacterium indicum]
MSTELKALDKPTKWPGANARLLALGQGQPIKPIDRLGLFSADEFERFVLEWADDYLARQVKDVTEVQQRGGSGDKGRDIVVWFGRPGDEKRYWHLYQCKRYSSAIGEGKALAEIGKVLYFSWLGDFPMPREYWFVTRKGVTNDLQDAIDQNKLGGSIISNWDKYCSDKITEKRKIKLDGDFLSFVQSIDFSFVRVKQPLELLSEHAKTKYHSIVFGSPLRDRPKLKPPPSTVAQEETNYVQQLYRVIQEQKGIQITCLNDFISDKFFSKLFIRSRASFYSAEGLKELAREHMENVSFFDDLLACFEDGLFYVYSKQSANGYDRLEATVLAAQAQQIDGHVLGPHLTPLDREGVCHHLANEGTVSWCEDE